MIKKIILPLATSAVILKNDEIFSGVLALRIQNTQILFRIYLSGFACNSKTFYAAFDTFVQMGTSNPKKKSLDCLRIWINLV